MAHDIVKPKGVHPPSGYSHAAGADPIWFGIFIVLMSEIAMITPPVGMNLFVIQSVRSDGGSLSDVI